ncbi:Succinate--CoA ligase (ADP-forming) [Phytophthora palmivora]|uniref:Succinate--CoA ligase (ADP-forming) n=1 Tax=Phytophthora palmivora TaxID=4796 RepID=A0A2P4YPD6_9STRA|nr:Succinate--CoA ligase (ADP-forming) [Phytophthora palmivora]
MPLLLPSIDELAFAVPLSSQTSQRSVSTATSELPGCATHGRISMRRRRSTAETELELTECTEEACTDPEHQHMTRRTSQQTDVDFRNSKHSSRDTQPDDDRVSSDGSFASEAERVSSVLSCGCSCVDVNELAITSSTVVIEDRQLAVVDKELRDFRKTLVRKLYTRLTKISGLARRKSSAPKPVF